MVEVNELMKRQEVGSWLQWARRMRWQERWLWRVAEVADDHRRQC